MMLLIIKFGELFMINGLPLVVTVLVEVGSSVVGTTGMLGEYAVKSLDKEAYPKLRQAGEIFFKTIQNASAAFALFILGSLVTHPVGIIAAGVFGVVMVITPIMKAVVQNSDNQTLKKALNILDHITNISAKTINTAIATAGIYLALGAPAALVLGAGISAFGIVTFRKA
jgi:hypothetical protein